MIKHEAETGFSVCKLCNTGIRLHEAGFEVSTYKCDKCGCFVAYPDEFFNVPIEVLSK